jgi:hypothetical protein
MFYYSKFISNLMFHLKSNIGSSKQKRILCGTLRITLEKIVLQSLNESFLKSD